MAPRSFPCWGFAGNPALGPTNSSTNCEEHQKFRDCSKVLRKSPNLAGYIRWLADHEDQGGVKISRYESIDILIYQSLRKVAC
jgi:hypothetical protein